MGNKYTGPVENKWETKGGGHGKGKLGNNGRQGIGEPQ
jgi:hypothetical protein